MFDVYAGVSRNYSDRSLRHYTKCAVLEQLSASRRWEEVQTHAGHSIAFYLFLHFETCDLDLWPYEVKSISLVRYPKVIPYTEFEYFGIIRFWVML